MVKLDILKIFIMCIINHFIPSKLGDEIVILPPFYQQWVCFLRSISYTLIIKNKEVHNGTR